MTQSLWAHWPRLQRPLQSARRLLLALDFDGTLTPIVDRPSRARLPACTTALLQALAHHPAISVALVSGRALRDLKRLGRVQGASYLGNHGLELVTAEGVWVHPAARRARAAMRAVRHVLSRTLQDAGGVLIEDKTWTLSIHYRCVSPAQRATVIRQVRCAAQPWVRRRLIRVGQGKMVMELRPCTTWGKGHAVRRLRQRLRLPARTTTIVIGDDQTDEEAFRLLRRESLTIVVGHPRRPSAARYRLANPHAVGRFLRALRALRLHHA